MDKPRLKAAQVPADLEPLFAAAERTVEAYFHGLSRNPERGTIAVDDQRYILVRSGALSVEFVDMVRSRFPASRSQEAEQLARSLLFDLAHSAGLTDARTFAERMGLSDPVERLSAGPLHFAHTGWAFVQLHPECHPVASDDYLLVYDHPYSFEAAAWQAQGRKPEHPCCVMNVGYSSGWCEASFGLPLAATEISCRGMGHAQCRFIMAPPERLREQTERYLAAHPELHTAAERLDPLEFLHTPARVGHLERMAERLAADNAALEVRVQARTAELTELNARLERELAARLEEEAQRLAVEKRLQESQRLESLGMLAGGVAHDFNNLLATILGSTELVRVYLMRGKEVEPLLNRMEHATEQATGLTRQLLALAGRAESRHQAVVLDSLAEDLLALLRASVGKNVKLVLSAKPDVVCYGDPAQLQQIFMNLVLNGAESLERLGGEVQVRLYTETLTAEELVVLRLPGQAQPGTFAVAEVRDSGCGMTAEVGARVFDPFFTTKGMGRGLGLASLRTILRAHRGALHLESELGVGTVFTVYLPLASETADPEGVLAPLKMLAGEVLVVDDEAAVRETTSAMVECLGLSVRAVADGASALELVRRWRPAVVVLDVSMPGMDGWETLAALRSLHPELPVLMCSGYNSVEIEHEGVPFLPKPFTRRGLHEVLCALLED